jgi:hypothetical protein
MRKSSLWFVLISLFLATGCEGPSGLQSIPTGASAVAEPTESAAVESSASPLTRPCGAPHQLCCLPDYTCKAGTCKMDPRWLMPLCPACGFGGAICCEGGACNSGFSCVSNICQSPDGGQDGR